MRHLHLSLFISLICFNFSLAQNKATYLYAVKDNEELKLDVYTPENITENQKLPTLLWIHGGGFMGSTRDNPVDAKLCKEMTKKGYVAVSISYRLSRKGKPTGFGCDCPKEDKLETFKMAVQDYYDAAKYIVKNADILHIDTQKIIAGGSSAGAETVLNAVYMKEFFLKDLEPYKNIHFASVWALAGALVNAEYITKDNAIPTVLFHGTQDAFVPFGSESHHLCKPNEAGYLHLDGAQPVVEKLNRLETPYFFYKSIGGGHELAAIPYDERLDNVIDFFKKTAFGNEVIQIKKVVKK